MWYCASLRKLKMATKVRQFYRLNFALSANIPFSRKPIFVLPLRLPIKVTLHTLSLSAYRNFSALLYHHRYDLASFFKACHNYCETASCTIPRFQFNKATWEVLKCGAEEGWRWWFVTIVWKMKYYLQSRSTEISYIQYNEGRLTGLVTSCVGTAFWNTLLKER